VAPRVPLADYIAAIGTSPIAVFADIEPWELTTSAEDVVTRLLTGVGAEFSLADGVAVHPTATVETGAVLKAPAIIGAHCFVAAGAYVRGGCWLDAHCTLGPGTELKSAFLFAGTKLAHFNFVGDSILGSGVNLEAGAIVANHRNENPERTIVICLGESRIETGVRKFGAVIGDGARIGANAVIAPGALLPPGGVVPRLALVDQGC
jgi:NDP-sugar pyrophosphorylase family protein